MYGVSDCGRQTGEYFYEHFSYGGNCRMSEFNAAVLRVQLKRLPEQHRRRNANARHLADMLNAVPGIRVMKPTPGTEELGYYVFPFLFDPEKFAGMGKHQLRERLRESGIPTVDSYPPLHRLICFRDQNLRRGIDYSRANWIGPEADSRFPVVTDVYPRSIELPHEVLLAETRELEEIPAVLRRIQSEG
jgi:3-amino-5-hydroxybenzoate synthase